MNLEIIAELAQGFEGNCNQAKLLIKAAASSGADAAKFQLVYADELATPDYKYYELFRSLEMTDEEWGSINVYAQKQNIELYLDVFGTRGLQLCENVGITGIKLHGTDISNVFLLKKIAESNIHRVYLGSGGANLNEIHKAISILQDKTVTILLGFQAYPTINEDNQIDRVRLLKASLCMKFSNCKVGFSDHADPTTPERYALAAVAIGAGADVIEKHLTLGKIMKMEDHESALNPDEFFEFSNVIRECAKSLGKAQEQNDFGMSKSEYSYRENIRRHVVASHDMIEGTIITPADLVLKRTSSKHYITDLESVDSKTLLQNVKANHAISINDIK